MKNKLLLSLTLAIACALPLRGMDVDRSNAYDVNLDSLTQENLFKNANNEAAHTQCVRMQLM